MSNRLMEYMLSNNFFYKGQHAYLKDKGTQTAIYQFTQNIFQGLERNELLIMGLFVDLTKAYEYVNHELLMKKLSMYGINGAVYEWFQSYLSGRQQRVVVTKENMNVKSEIKPIKIGIPQGSIIEPIMFILYINDMSNCLINVNSYLTNYADDTNVIIMANNWEALLRDSNYTFETLLNWFTNEKLLINK